MAVEAGFLLFTLNDVLSRTALLVQPLQLPAGDDFADVPALDIPLPLSAHARSRAFARLLSAHISSNSTVRTP